MARKGLKNVVRERRFRNGEESWKLSTKAGEPIAAFDTFCDQNSELAFRTQKRYGEVASRFIDYLYEAKALDQAVKSSHLNAVVQAYPTLLRDGSAITAKRVRESGNDTWLAEVAEGLNWTRLAPKSFDNTLAAVNRFLRLSETLAREANEKAALFGIETKGGGYRALIEALDGNVSLSTFEVAAMKQNSMFGNVAKFAPKGILRPRRLRRPVGTAGGSARHLDFPRDALPALIAAATSWRDKCLWLILAATGIRLSEALNLLLDDIDLEAQRIFVFDPNGRRGPIDDRDPNRFRFKGRTMAYTYQIPELRRDLFFALQQYLRFEFVPCRQPGEPTYLLQYVEAKRRGAPLVDASYAALTKPFKQAVRAAKIPRPMGRGDWTLHSLRHMYGVYIVNDLPIDPARGLFGVALVDAQMMMGHETIGATAHYARSKHRRVEAKLEASDLAMLGLTPEELLALPSFNVHLLAA